MRALTLTQPWSGLVASGIKLVENRPRKIIKRDDFGKPFAIHASKVIDEGVYDRIKEIDVSLFTQRGYASWYHLSRVTSAVIAVATLADALYIGGNSAETTRRMLYRAFGDGHDQERWTFGPTCYVLRDVRSLPEPVSCRGWQGFWTLPADAERDVVRQLRCDQGGPHKLVGGDVQCSECLQEVRSAR
jgi:hypothetical protein